MPSAIEEYLSIPPFAPTFTPPPSTTSPQPQTNIFPSMSLPPEHIPHTSNLPSNLQAILQHNLHGDTNPYDHTSPSSTPSSPSALPPSPYSLPYFMTPCIIPQRARSQRNRKQLTTPPSHISTPSASRQAYTSTTPARAIYTYHYGPLPRRLLVTNTCNSISCIEPSHLMATTIRYIRLLTIGRILPSLLQWEDPE